MIEYGFITKGSDALFQKTEILFKAFNNTVLIILEINRATITKQKKFAVNDFTLTH